jgi:ribosomal-protein-alanine N-acetyltransferase
MFDSHFFPFPELTSARLNFRKVNKDDVPEIIDLRGNIEVMKYINRDLITNSTEAIKYIDIQIDELNNKKSIHWMICLKENPKAIGIIRFNNFRPTDHRAEIGCMMHPEFQGKGLVSEAIQRIVDFGFNEMQLNTIEATILSENTSSKKAVLRNNFIQEAHFREYRFFNGIYQDVYVFTLHKQNYLDSIERGR